MSETVSRTPPSQAPDSGSDYLIARNRMVDSQIRPVQVSDPRVIQAMRDLPRERFVPVESAGLAYADRPIKLGCGRVLMEPMIIGRLLQAAAPRRGEKALVVGAGTGYSAALLAMLGLDVVALEQDSDLAAKASRICAGLGLSVRFELGPLAEGWAAGAPYAFILIDGAVRALPASLSAQLAPEGRLGAVLWPEGRVGTAILAEASTHGLRARPQFDAATPLIPELAPAPRFSF